MITGAVLFGVFIGNAINLMQEMDADRRVHVAKAKEVKIYICMVETAFANWI